MHINKNKIRKYEANPGYTMRTGLKNKTTQRRGKNAFSPLLGKTVKQKAVLKAYSNSVLDESVNIFTENKLQSWRRKNAPTAKCLSAKVACACGSSCVGG